MSSSILNLIKHTVPLEISSDPPRFIGTGFLITCPGFEGKYSPIILVTSKHVVKDCQNTQFRWNVNNKIMRFLIGTEVMGLKCDWIFHPNDEIDLAITMAPSFGDSDNSMVHGYTSTAIDDVEQHDLGSEIFYFGFPLGTGADVEYPHKAIVRKGIISSISDAPTFIIEANVFPGTSGSPVFIQRESTFEIIGVISSYIPYIDIAVSMQSKKPRITFEENSGLAYVVRAKYIFDIMKTDNYRTQAVPIINLVKKFLEENGLQ